MSILPNRDQNLLIDFLKHTISGKPRWLRSNLCDKLSKFEELAEQWKLYELTVVRLKNTRQSFLIELAPALRGFVYEQGAVEGVGGTPYTVDCVCARRTATSGSVIGHDISHELGSTTGG